MYESPLESRLQEDSSNALMPLYLRRLPALLVVVATVGLGIVEITVSHGLVKSHSWASGLLTNLGSTTVMFSPLLFLTSVFGRQIVRAQNAQADRVTRVETQVGAVRNEMQAALSELSDRTRDRIAADRSEDIGALDAIRISPSSPLLAKVLRLGSEMRFTSVHGPRVHIHSTDVFARWIVSKDESIDDIKVAIERLDGTEIGSTVWYPGQFADELGHTVARILQDAHLYPGDLAYQAGEIFEELHFLLELGYRACTGAGGLVDPLGPVVQLCGEKWVLNDFAIDTQTFPPYQITLDRLYELDWDSHLRGRVDVDIGGFREAFDAAIALIESGRLVPPVREE